MYRNEVAKLLGLTLEEVNEKLAIIGSSHLEEIPLTLVNYWLEVEVAKKKFS